jgi:hypothetical protein
MVHPAARDGDRSTPDREDTLTAPGSFITPGFGPEATFEGRIVAVLEP